MGDGKKITGELIDGLSCSTIRFCIPAGVPCGVSVYAAKTSLESAPGVQLAVFLSDQRETDHLSDRDNAFDTLYRNMADHAQRKGVPGERTGRQGGKT